MLYLGRGEFLRLSEPELVDVSVNLDVRSDSRSAFISTEKQPLAVKYDQTGDTEEDVKPSFLLLPNSLVSRIGHPMTLSVGWTPVV